MAIPETLLALLQARGPSGNETAPSAVFRDACSAFADVTFDTLGSTVAKVAGTGSGRSLAIVGHSDEIGLIVHHIDDTGFLWFKPVGGWDAQILVGQRITVLTRDGEIPGTVGRKPIHLLKGDARKEVVELENLHIDIGAVDGDDARTRVRLGDVAVPHADPVELRGGRVMGRALDNRVGCYVAVEVARRVAEAGGATGDVYAVAVSQEETTFGGSYTTAFSLKPDTAVIVDGCWATDQPGIDETRTGRFRLGDGAVLGRGTTLAPALFELLHETAEAEDIPFVVEAFGGNTQTDADAFHRAAQGIPSAVVSVPMRYLHSPSELADLADIEATVALLTAFALRLPGDLDLRR